MRKIIIASVIFSLLFAVVNTEAATKTTTPKPLKGKIVSLDDVVKGKKDLKLTKEKPNELLADGTPLVFLYNKKIYFVQTEGGDFAFKKIVSFAHREWVGITGKTKTVNGINIIIMSDINAMD